MIFEDDNNYANTNRKLSYKVNYDIIPEDKRDLNNNKKTNDNIVKFANNKHSYVWNHRKGINNIGNSCYM